MSTINKEPVVDNSQANNESVQANSELAQVCAYQAPSPPTRPAALPRKQALSRVTLVDALYRSRQELVDTTVWLDPASQPVAMWHEEAGAYHASNVTTSVSRVRGWLLGRASDVCPGCNTRRAVGMASVDKDWRVAARAIPQVGGLPGAPAGLQPQVYRVLEVFCVACLEMYRALDSLRQLGKDLETARTSDAQAISRGYDVIRELVSEWRLLESNVPIARRVATRLSEVEPRVLAWLSTRKPSLLVEGDDARAKERVAVEFLSRLLERSRRALRDKDGRAAKACANYRDYRKWVDRIKDLVTEGEAEASVADWCESVIREVEANAEQCAAIVTAENALEWLRVKVGQARVAAASGMPGAVRALTNRVACNPRLSRAMGHESTLAEAVALGETLAALRADFSREDEDRS